MDLLSHLNERHRHELGEIVIAQPDDVLAALVTAADQSQAWDTLLPMTASMSADVLQRFADLEQLQRPDTIRQIVQVATEAQLWPVLLPLVRRLPRATRTVVAKCARKLGLQDIVAQLQKSG
ncbi:MAG: hypothetical protein ABI232_13735 [Jatrophihabitantaceae bacterium]